MCTKSTVHGAPKTNVCTAPNERRKDGKLLHLLSTKPKSTDSLHFDCWCFKNWDACPWGLKRCLAAPRRRGVTTKRRTLVTPFTKDWNGRTVSPQVSNTSRKKVCKELAFDINCVPLYTIRVLLSLYSLMLYLRFMGLVIFYCCWYIWVHLLWMATFAKIHILGKRHQQMLPMIDVHCLVCRENKPMPQGCW